MTLHDAPGGVNSGDNTSWAFDSTSTSTSTSSTSTSSTSSSTSTSVSSTSVSSTSTSVSSTSTSVSSTSTSSTSISTSSTSSSTSSTSTSVSTSSTSVSVSTSSTSVSSTSSSISSTSVSSTTTSTSTTLPPSTGSVILMIGQDIVFEGSVARDYEEKIYAYGPVYISIPDSTADVTVYVAVPYKNANLNALYPPKNYQFRTVSEQHNTAVQAGYMVDPLHFTGGAEREFVCPEGAAIVRVSINIAP